jgi:hypothetical protein
MAASLLLLGVLGAQPASACTSTAPDPGEPTGGIVGYTGWYAAADAHSACEAEAAVEQSAGEDAHEALAAAGPSVVAAGVAATDALQPVGPLLFAALNTYPVSTERIILSQTWDLCSALLGPVWPPCFGDTPVSQPQSCPVAVPRPVGGVLGDTLENANAQVQMTCWLALAATSAVPNADEAEAFAAAAQSSAGAVAGPFSDAPGDAGAAANGFAGDALVNTCIWLQDDPDCLA